MVLTSRQPSYPRSTDAVLDEVKAWQNRPLESLYPVLYLDGIVVKVHKDKRVIKKTVFVALGVNFGRPEGAFRSLACRNRRCYILAIGVNRASEPRC